MRLLRTLLFIIYDHRLTIFFHLISRYCCDNACIGFNKTIDAISHSTGPDTVKPDRN